MDPKVFDNILACIENMDERQTTQVLTTILRKKRVIPIMCFIKEDYDAVATAYGDEPLTDDEFIELERHIMSAKKSQDQTLPDMLLPISKWLTRLVSSAKASVKEIQKDFKIGVEHTEELSKTTSNASSLETIHLTRTTDELAYIACPPNTQKFMGTQWLSQIQCKPLKLNFWLKPPME
jgi:hypothetical protein